MYLKKALVCFLIGVPATIQAQDAEMQTRFMMLNQHQCPSENMEAILDLMEDVFAPSLSELQGEGAVHDWGILTHAWGDEYNFNFYMVTESHHSFVEAWDSLMTKTEEIDPEWFDKFAPLCVAHKDNMYTLHRYSE